MKTRVALALILTGSIFAACSYTLPSTDPSLLCGNGVVDDAEFCDDGNQTDADGCDSNCTMSKCGNGIQAGSEECDDGNDVNDDTCTNGCNKPRCGDGLVSAGEGCDDGNVINNDGCDADCQPSPCGNGTVEAGEECDDGNTHWYDECSPECKSLNVKATCGNGVVEANESCDDSNTSNGDTCNATCTLKGESSIFVGQRGMSGVLDGVGEGARVYGWDHMALLGDKIYIAGDEAVRVIDIPTREVKTLAGAEQAWGHRDDPEGAKALFRNLRGITTDGTTIWVSDPDNHVIRSIGIAPPHEVKTVAGVQSTTMDYVPPVDGAAKSALFDSPRGLTYLNGLVYIVEAYACVLRVFDPVKETVSTIAGAAGTCEIKDEVGANARFGSPRHITVGGPNTLFIAESFDSTIRSFDVPSATVATVTGSSACGYVDDIGGNAKMYGPRGVAFDGTSLFFADGQAHAVRQIRLSDISVSTLSGSPPTCTIDCSCGMTDPAGEYVDGDATIARWNFPYEMVWHARSRSLFVSDGANDVIRRIQ